MTDADFAASFQNARIRKAEDTSRTAVGRAIAKIPIGNAILQQLYYEDPAPHPGEAHLLVSFKLPDDFNAHGAGLEETKLQLLKWTDEQLGIAGAKGTVIDTIEEGTKHMHIAPRAAMQGRALHYANAQHNQFVVKYELPDSPETAQARETLNARFGKRPALGRS